MSVMADYDSHGLDIGISTIAVLLHPHNSNKIIKRLIMKNHQWTRFLGHLDYAYSILDKKGIPFRQDHGCQIGMIELYPPINRLQSSSYSNDEIWIASSHVDRDKKETAKFIIHEACHYWIEKFPEVMSAGHAFRVPRVRNRFYKLAEKTGLGYSFKVLFHNWLYKKNDRFIDTYDQVDSQECLCEFMAYYLVEKPDLRSVKSSIVRKRYKACKRIIPGLRKVYKKQ